MASNLPHRPWVYLTTLVAVIFLAPLDAAELLFPNADFETGSLECWTQNGDAFQFQPTKGDNPQARGRETSGHEGEFWIGGFEKYIGQQGSPGDTFGDVAVGELISPEFKIQKPFITFLIGGGYHPNSMGVLLRCEGEEIELATGSNSETMTPCSYDVSRFVGKHAKIVVYDRAQSEWGHINVDSFRAADEPLPGSTAEFVLATGIPTEPGADSSYSEQLRPQFHFTARKNWLNDPNGMVFDGRKYHLFFQHNPLAPVWGNMTWGHATSPDMIHWTQQKHALLPYRVDRRSGTIFSGTAVVDHNNSLGVQQGNQKTLCAFFTFACAPKFYQAMAYSTDGGDSWKYWNEGRAVVENQGFDDGERDPKVFWHEPSKHWVMVLWVRQNPGKVRIFVSKDLTQWEHASDLDRDWAFECMDMVFLPVDGDEQETKAVIYDASFDYEIGTFDGREFHTEYGPHKAGGGDFYAAQTFNNNRNGRAVQIGWMRGGPNPAEKYGLPYNQQMAFPCELTLHSAGDDVRLFVWPIKEIASLVTSTNSQAEITLHEGENVLSGEDALDLVDLEINFEPGTAKELRIDVSGAELIYDCDSHDLAQRSVNDRDEPQEVIVFQDLQPHNGEIQLRFLIDRLSVESFAFHGEKYFAAYYSPRSGNETSVIESVGGDCRINHLEIRRLKSAWRDD